MLCTKVDTDILAFFNAVQDPETLVETIKENDEGRGYGLRATQAASILEYRSALPDGKFCSVLQLSQIPGLGKETLGDIFDTFYQPKDDTANDDGFLAINEKVLVEDLIGQTWIHDEQQLIFEFSPNGYVLLKEKGGVYYEDLIDVVYAQELDAFTFSEIPPILASLLETPPTGDSFFYPENAEQVLIYQTNDNLLEIAQNGKAWVLNRSNFPETTIFTKKDQCLIEEAAADYQEEEHELILNDINIEKDDVDGIPKWWTDKQTEEFLEKLGERVAKEIKKKLDAGEVIKEALIERMIEEQAAKHLAKTLAKIEAKRQLEKLLKKGVPKEEALRTVNKLRAKLEKEYLYKHPNLIKRFSPLTKFKSLKKLLKSPKTWLRGRVAKFFIKGLGKRVLAIPGLVDDLYTIGEAMYEWWRANKAWEGARESERQANEMERRYREMIENFTPEERKRFEERKKRQAEFFRRLREEQREKAKKRIKIDA